MTEHHDDAPSAEPVTATENRPDACPHCGGSLQGEPIPEESRHLYREGATHFRREVLIHVRGVRDGGLYYACPDCGRAWPRWSGTHPMVAVSERYAARHNASWDADETGE